MIARLTLCPLLLLATTLARGEVYVDAAAFGESLGGWKSKKGRAAEYEISGSIYRTFQPEVTPSPDGGIFVSVRIDHVRGFLASDDYASLELSFQGDGTLVSAQSTLALQGRTITSELIKGGAAASTSVAAPGIDRAVKIGTDLVADLSSKLLREKIVEPGRVSFPAAIRHNYNLLYQTVKLSPANAVALGAAPQPGTPPAPGSTTPPATSPPAGITPPASAPATPPVSPTAPTVPAPSAPAADPAKPATAPAAEKKSIPIPEVKPWNGSTPPQIGLPDKKQTSLLEVGGAALKLARDVVKTQAD